MSQEALAELQVAAFGPNGGTDSLTDESVEKQSLKAALLEYKNLLSLKLPERKRYLPFLPEAGNAMVFGPRGIGKTWVQLSLAAALTTGRPFLRWPVSEPSGVLYVDGEMALEELQQRITALLPEPPQAPLFFLTSEWTYHKLQRDLVLTSEEVRCEISSILNESQGIRVVILDNISCLFSGIDEDKKRDWEPIAAWLIRLRHRGLTTVLVHHSGKAGHQRGTSGREDSLDTVIQLSRPTGYDPREGCHFELNFTKCRSAKGDDVTPIDAKLQEHDGRLDWTWRTLEDSKEDKARSLFAEGVTSPKDLAEEMGISKGYASKLLRKIRAEQ